MAWLVGWLASRKRGVNPESALFNILLVGLVSARVAFVAWYFNDYSVNFVRTIDIRDGGFMPIAGFIGGALMLAYYLWKDRKSTRLNSSHVRISYAVFCLKKKII